MRNVTLGLLIVGAFFVRRMIWMPFGQPLIPAATAGAQASRSLPADFPTDVPIPSKASCQDARKMQGLFLAQLSIDEPVTAMVQFYETGLANQGWQVERLRDEDQEQDQESVTGSKDGHSVMVSIARTHGASSELRIVYR